MGEVGTGGMGSVSKEGGGENEGNGGETAKYQSREKR